MDDKTPPAAPGARTAQRCILLAGLEHTHGVVLGQTEVDRKSNEITAFAPCAIGSTCATR